MSHFLSHTFPPLPALLPTKSQPLLCTPNSNHFSPIRSLPISSTLIPSRDLPISFGKHKGKPLGTLPSTYLKWVSNNLRARDFEQWAKLADEVLQDPVYKDRLEWEFAEKLLSGEWRTENPVENLVELSERFGWDYEDKVGWSRVDFELLGSSKGGRIPRRGDSKVAQVEKVRPLSKGKGNLGTLSKELCGEGIARRGCVEDAHIEKVGALRRGKGKLGALGRKSNVGFVGGEKVEGIVKRDDFRETQVGKVGASRSGGKLGGSGVVQSEKVGPLGGSSMVKGKLEFLGEGEEGESGRQKREERIERQRLKRGGKVRLGSGWDEKKNRFFGQGEDFSVQDQDEDQNAKKASSRFPGREGLIKKVLSRRAL